MSSSVSKVSQKLAFLTDSPYSIQDKEMILVVMSQKKNILKVIYSYTCFSFCDRTLHS
jgi:hypothetical protein